MSSDLNDSNRIVILHAKRWKSTSATDLHSRLSCRLLSEQFADAHVVRPVFNDAKLCTSTDAPLRLCQHARRLSPSFRAFEVLQQATVSRNIFW